MRGGVLQLWSLLLLISSACSAAVGLRALRHTTIRTIPAMQWRMSSSLSVKQHSMTDTDEAEVARIAGPALINTLLDPFLSVIDTFWVSRLGVIPLGAVAASSELFTMTFAASLALRETAASTLAR